MFDQAARYRMRDAAIAATEVIWRRKLTDEEREMIAFAIGHMMGQLDAAEFKRRKAN